MALFFCSGAWRSEKGKKAKVFRKLGCLDIVYGKIIKGIFLFFFDKVFIIASGSLFFSSSSSVRHSPGIFKRRWKSFLLSQRVVKNRRRQRETESREGNSIHLILSYELHSVIRPLKQHKTQNDTNVYLGLNVLKKREKKKT